MYKFLIADRKILSCFFLLVLFNSTVSKPSFATDYLGTKEKGLELIANFSDRMCKDIPLSGGNRNIELSGGAKAELNGLIKGLVDLGFEGAAKYEKSDYKGLLQADLAKALETSTNCKLEIFRDLKGRILGINPENDDPLYIFTLSGELDRIYESFQKTNPPPDVAELLVTIYMIGALSKEVVQFGKDYKSYKTPESKYFGLELLARPSSVYTDDRGRKFRTVHIESRQAGGIWEKMPDETYILEKGDWKKLQ